MIDSEPGKWENMRILFRKKNVFFEIVEEIYDTVSPKMTFFVKKKTAGILTHNKWVVDTKTAQNLHRFFKKNC